MAEEKKEPKIIGNKSEGHKYHYASLADIARAGVTIPPMRVATLVDGEQNPILVNGQPVEYIEALRTYTNGSGEIVMEEWIRGSRIVIPSSNSMNEAQAYGAALTYARRYTALTLLGIACDDDNKVEAHSEADMKERADRAMNDLKEFYIKAGNKADTFDEWVKSKAPNGMTNQIYGQLLAECKHIINERLEKEGKS